MAFHVAFYSYKGGVGRSLALSNVAWSLAAAGRRVVLVDLDLEAPGLDAVPDLAPRRRRRPRKGFLELASSYARTGRLPSIRSHIHPAANAPLPGRVWLVPAGRPGPAYQRALHELDWARLHPKKGTDPFLDGFKAAIEDYCEPDYVLVDARTGLSDVGGLTTHRLADAVVLVFNLTWPCIEGSVRAYRSMVSDASRVRSVTLVASPVPPLAPEEGSIVARRLQRAAELMPQGVSHGRRIHTIEYHPAMALADELAVRDPERWPAAERYLRVAEALQLESPEEVLATAREARHLQESGRVDEAVALLEAFCMAHPRNAAASEALGDVLLESRRPAEAAEAYERAVATAPELPHLRRRLGEARLAAGDAEGAVEALQAAIDAGAAGQDAWAALASAHQFLGQTHEETEARREAVKAVLSDGAGDDWAAADREVLEADFVRALDRAPPLADLDSQAFWDLLMGSLSLPLPDKLGIARAVLDGSLDAEGVARIRALLRDGQRRAEEIFGPGTARLQARIREALADPTDVAAVLALTDGGADDGWLRLYAARLLAEGSEDQLRLLREAVAEDPALERAWDALGQSLGAAARRDDGRRRLALLREGVRAHEEACRVEGDASLRYHLGLRLLELAEELEGVARQEHLRQAVEQLREAHGADRDRAEVLEAWGSALVELAAMGEGASRRRLLRTACRRFREAVERRPTSYAGLFAWGNALVELARESDPIERIDYLQEAVRRYEEAVLLRPRRAEALHNWGAALLLLGEQDSPRWLHHARERFLEALSVRPGAPRTLHGLGRTLLALARAGEGEVEQAHAALAEAAEADLALPGLRADLGRSLVLMAEEAHDTEREGRFREAEAVFAEALSEAPGDVETLKAWGDALLRHARLVDVEEQGPLLRDACGRYAEALQLAPGDYRALNNWGHALLLQARGASGEHRWELLEAAASRFEESDRLGPSLAAMANGIGATRLLLAGDAEAGERDALLEAAEAWFQEAEQRADGAGIYNLACVRAAREDWDGALELLSPLFDDAAMAAYAAADPDLAALWQARPDARPGAV